MEPFNNPPQQQPVPPSGQNPRGNSSNPSQFNGPGAITNPAGAPVTQTGIYSSPSVAPTQYGDNNQLVTQSQAVSSNKSNKKGSNKLVIIIIAGIALLAVLSIVAIISSAGQKPKDNQANQQPATIDQAQSLKPAQAIDLEQANNSIGQDLSSLDDEKDFPATSLDDKTLGL